MSCGRDLNRGTVIRVRLYRDPNGNDHIKDDWSLYKVDDIRHQYAESEVVCVRVIIRSVEGMVPVHRFLIDSDSDALVTVLPQKDWIAQGKVPKGTRRYEFQVVQGSEVISPEPLHDSRRPSFVLSRLLTRLLQPAA